MTVDGVEGKDNHPHDASVIQEMNCVILESSVNVGRRATGMHGCRVDAAHGVAKMSRTDLTGGPGGWGTRHSFQEHWKRTESGRVITN